MNDNDLNKEFNSYTLIEFIVRWKKPLAILTLSGAIISVIVSFMIQEKFKSTVILFPTTNASVSESLLSEHSVSTKDILKFGEEEDAEQLLQVLNSYEIRDRIIKKYDLFNHYEIDKNSSFPLTKLHNMYDDNISFRRTEYMSIQIDVLDKDPKIAADIANTITELIDSVINRMQKKRAFEAYKIVKNQYENLKAEIQRNEDSLKVLQGLGIQDYESQSQALNEALGNAYVKNNLSAQAEIQKKLDLLNKYGGSYVTIRNLNIYEIEKLTQIETKLVEAEVDAKQELSHKFIVNKGEVAEKKTYPIRWLIVTVSTIATFILSLMLLMIFEGIKKKKID